ncbi:hypothetical protein [Williamsia herbipolensis]|uniref:hypothetical protein n=1 Tax=Williamsia herbipolensis TaxID=1603258 RepID=UPI0005F81240|nr:hypothetical protein [Williamsia herbipolensis]MCX6469334.1 hypothetical protein [Mycobacteriales bacterium]
MDSSVVAAFGLVAAIAAVIAYTHHRRREGDHLGRDAELAASLRTLADGDPVRLAAVDEFETTIYRRLFAASTTAPRLVATAWSLGGLVLALAAALVTEPGSGALVDVAFYLALAAAVGFGVATIVHAVRAVLAATVVPRIAFDDIVEPAPVTTDAANTADRDTGTADTGDPTTTKP